MERRLTGKVVIAGSGRGRAVVADEPLSFWGGLSPKTGEIIDRRHPQCGLNVKGRVFVLPWSKGSSTGSAVLLESIRAAVAPAAIVTAKTDPMLALGAIVADEMYHRTVPIVVLGAAAFGSIREGDYVVVGPDGTVTVTDEETDDADT